MVLGDSTIIYPLSPAPQLPQIAVLYPTSHPHPNSLRLLCWILPLT